MGNLFAFLENGSCRPALKGVFPTTLHSRRSFCKVELSIGPKGNWARAQHLEIQRGLDAVETEKRVGHVTAPSESRHHRKHANPTWTLCRPEVPDSWRYISQALQYYQGGALYSNSRSPSRTRGIMCCTTWMLLNPHHPLPPQSRFLSMKAQIIQTLRGR